MTSAACAHAHSSVPTHWTSVKCSAAKTMSTRGDMMEVPATAAVVAAAVLVPGRRPTWIVVLTAVQAPTSGMWSGRTVSVVCSWSRSRSHHHHHHHSRTWPVRRRDTLQMASSGREDRAARVLRTTDCAAVAAAARDASWRLHGDRRMLTSRVTAGTRWRWIDSYDDGSLRMTSEGTQTATTARSWQVSARRYDGDTVTTTMTSSSRQVRDVTSTSHLMLCVVFNSWMWCLCTHSPVRFLSSCRRYGPYPVQIVQYVNYKWVVIKLRYCKCKAEKCQILTTVNAKVNFWLIYSAYNSKLQKFNAKLNIGLRLLLFSHATTRQVWIIFMHALLFTIHIFINVIIIACDILGDKMFLILNFASVIFYN